MARVDAFCIDRYEAHLVYHREPTRPHAPYDRPRQTEQYRARSARGVVPQAYISRVEAEQACRHAGKRLCRAAEWHRACGGSKRWVYPYGNDPEPDRCNTHKRHVLPKIFGRRTVLTYDHHYNNPWVNQEPGFLAKTAEYRGCVNDYGVFDMVGNLHEWVADEVSASLARRIPIAYGSHLLGARGKAVFMGGYFSSRGEHGAGCMYVTTNHSPDYHDYSIGFRCCAEPKPATGPR
jgi:sulfatase modifying factor 1